MIIPPFENRSVDQKALEAIERPVGQLFLGFSLLDHQLDFWLMTVFPIAVRGNVASKMPFQTGEKIGLLQKSFSRLPELAAFHPQANELLAKVDKLNEIRNAIAHGAISHSSMVPEPQIVFARLRYSKHDGVHLQTDHALTFAKIVKAAEETMDVTISMHELTLQLLQVEP